MSRPTSWPAFNWPVPSANHVSARYFDAPSTRWLSFQQKGLATGSSQPRHLLGFKKRPPWDPEPQRPQLALLWCWSFSFRWVAQS